MSEKKIIYLLPMPPFKNFIKTFFVEEIQGENFDCEYWDIAELLNYRLDNPSEKYTFPYRKINSFWQLRNAINSVDCKKTVFVPQLSAGLTSTIVFYLLRMLGCKTVFFGRGYLPNINGSSDRTKCRACNAIKMIMEGNFKFVLTTVINTLLCRLIPIKNFDVTFVSGLSSESRHQQDSKKIIHIDHIDVDAANEITESIEEKPDSYCVFLDEYLPYHPDWSLHGGITVNAEHYYRNLRHFFDLIEEQNNTTVVIAAHPKSSYRDDVYGGRSVYSGITNQLTRQCDVVLTHASTAISFAIIHSKPLCLLVSDEITRIHPNLAKIIENTSEILDCVVWDYEKEKKPCLSSIKLNDQAYQEYYSQYLSANNSGEHSCLIVCRELNELLI